MGFFNALIGRRVPVDVSETLEQLFTRATRLGQVGVNQYADGFQAHITKSGSDISAFVGRDKTVAGALEKAIMLATEREEI